MFDVSVGFIDVLAIQMGPQQGMRDENCPPATAHVGQRDEISIHAVFIPVVQDEGKNF